MGEDTSKGPTHANKVLRRTLVGGSIALVTAGLLFLVKGESGPSIVHALAALLLIGSILEASRMAQDVRRAAWSLGAAALMGWVMVYDLLQECACAQLGISAWGHILCASLSMAVVASAVAPIFSQRFGAAVGLLLSSVAFWLIYKAPIGGLEWIFFPSLFVFALLGARPGQSRQRFRDVLSDVVRALWFVPALSGLALLRVEFGIAGLISLILLSKIGDIFGYFGGSLLGRHHPLPRLSPGKTTEGFACSFLGGVGVGVALAHWGVLPIEGVSLVGGALLGGGLNVAAQAGDLIESMVKRRSGVKDSGSTFGPSGGFLDLLDSFFMTVPVALLIGLLTRG